MIFPTTATEGTLPPYVIYLSSETVKVKTLDGFLDIGQIPVEINIVTGKYEDLKPLADAVLEKILSFEGRNIGTDGPFVQEIAYEPPVELYEEKKEWYRTNIQLEVSI